MADLKFIYGTMESGKSLELLKRAHMCEYSNKKVVCFTSEKDIRQGSIPKDKIIGKIKTRLGTERAAWLIERVSSVFDLVKELEPKHIFIDEVQFIPKSILYELIGIVDKLKISVSCFGLLSDFKGALFENSNTLLAYADNIEELVSLCPYCNNKAQFNMRLINGVPVFEGEQIAVNKDEVEYKPVCRKCYLQYKLFSE